MENKVSEKSENSKFDLKTELKNLGMTQKDFAELIGVSRVTVSDWNRGKTKIPNIAVNFVSLFNELKDCQNINLKLLKIIK